MSEVASPILPWHLSLFERLNQLDADKKLPHAMMLLVDGGPVAETFVSSFAARLMCDSPTLVACGHCKSCHLIAAHSHPDIIYVRLEEKAKQLKIEQIRKVINFNTQTAQIGQRKIVTLLPADAMNINAANALLKCLEEPAGDTIYLLQSAHQSRLLPTILSRCQQFVLPKPNDEQADQWLSAVVAEKLHRERLLFFAQGDPIKAAEFYEKKQLLVLDEYAEQLTSVMLKQGSLVEIAARIQKTDVVLWIDFLQILFLNLLKLHHGLAREESLLSLFVELAQKPRFPQATYHFLEAIQSAKAELVSQNNPNIALLVESLLFKWQQISQRI